MEPNYNKILQAKVDHYGETKAAYEFAAEEYARQCLKNQVEAVIKWLDSWDDLKDTAIPLRFKEEFAKPLLPAEKLFYEYCAEQGMDAKDALAYRWHVVGMIDYTEWLQDKFGR